MTYPTDILYWCVTVLIGIVFGLSWHLLELRWLRRRFERASSAFSNPRTNERLEKLRRHKEVLYFTRLHRGKQTLRQS